MMCMPPGEVLLSSHYFGTISTPCLAFVLPQSFMQHRSAHDQDEGLGTVVVSDCPWSVCFSILEAHVLLRSSEA